MSYRDMPFVVRTEPGNCEADVLTTSSIKLWFSTDIDRETLLGNFIVQETSGTKVEGSINYKDRVLSFTPTRPLLPGTTYIVIVVGDSHLEDGKARGILSILGYPMAGNHTFSFVTQTSSTLPAPLLTDPPDQSVLPGVPPTLTWQELTDAVAYRVYLADNPGMEPVLWETRTENNTVVPNFNFIEGEYFWQVTAVDGNEHDGLRSAVSGFYIDLTPSAPVVPEDDSYNLSQTPLEPSLVKPDCIFNVMVDIGKLEVFLPYNVQIDQIAVKIAGNNLGGNPTEDHRTVPAEIALENINGQTKIIISIEELKENQVYTVKVITPVEPLQWQFVTNCSPFYSSYEQFLIDADEINSPVSVAMAARFIHQASLICFDILLEEGTREEDIPVSPSFPMQQYTRYKSVLDYLMTAVRPLMVKGRAGVSKHLGEFQIEVRNEITATEVNLIHRALINQVKYWETRLRGGVYGVDSAVKAGASYPYPLTSRRIGSGQ